MITRGIRPVAAVRSRRLLLACDGQVIGKTPVEIEVLPAALEV